MTTRDAFSEAFARSSRNGVDASIKVTKPKMSARKLFSQASAVASPIRGDAIIEEEKKSISNEAGRNLGAEDCAHYYLPLAITESMRPNSLAARSTQDLISSGFPISTAEPTTRAPLVAPLKRENSSPRIVRAQNETLAPSVKKASTMDLPIPFDPPRVGY